MEVLGMFVMSPYRILCVQL